MISGGRVVEGTRVCLPFENIQDVDLNKDKYPDAVLQSTSECLDDYSIMRHKPTLFVELSVREGNGFTTVRSHLRPLDPKSNGYQTHLTGNWRWQVAAQKGSGTFNVGDRVRTNEGAVGQIVGFQLYLDPDFNIVRRLAEVTTTNSANPLLFDLNALTLTHSLSLTLKPQAEIFAEDARQKYYADDFKRLEELFEKKNYAMLDLAERKEVDAIERKLGAALNLSADQFLPDRLARDYFWNQSAIALGLDRDRLQ